MQSYTMSEESKLRWKAWWDCDLADRPVLCSGTRSIPPDSVRSMPDGHPPEIPINRPTDPDKQEAFDWFFNIDCMLEGNLKNFSRWNPGCDASPQFDTRWSVAFCLPFGVKTDCNKYAAWCEPEEEGRDCSFDFHYDYDGLWHRWLVDGTKRIAESGKNLYYITPVMWGNHSADILSNLVGLNQLMIDVMDQPDQVRRALETITDAQIKVFDELRSLEKLTGLDGTRNYTGTWSQDKCLSFDCDVSAMLSPEQYKTIFLPPLLRIMQTVKHRIYHLDGPVCLQHLPTLLGLDDLHAIQWVPGAGHEEITQWYDMIDSIQRAKKSVILNVNYDQVIDVCKRLKPQGLCLAFSSPSVEKMHEMEERVAGMYR